VRVHYIAVYNNFEHA